MEEVMCIHQYFNDKTGCDGCAMGMIVSCQTCQKLPGTCYQPVKTENEERRREQEENFMMIYHDIERPGLLNCLNGCRQRTFSRPLQVQNITVHTQAAFWTTFLMCITGCSRKRSRQDMTRKQ